MNHQALMIRATCRRTVIITILGGCMAMAVMRIPYIDTSHAIPYPYLEQSVTKRSAGISKFDQAKGTDFNFDLLQKC